MDTMAKTPPHNLTRRCLGTMKGVKETPITLHPVTTEDIPKILKIESISFHSPWTEGMFLEELTNPFSHAFLAKTRADGKVIGYIFYQTAVQEMHILNLAVHPLHRSKGVGTLLLHHSLSQTRQSDLARFVYLEVRDNNFPAILLYRKFGFTPLGIRKNYYPKEHVDAIIMGRSLV